MLREVLGEHAIFVEPDDVGQWAEIMESLSVDGDALRTLKEGGIAKARQYSAKRLAEGTLSIYREVLS